jgi:hypothetical protein
MYGIYTKVILSVCVCVCVCMYAFQDLIRNKQTKQLAIATLSL